MTGSGRTPPKTPQWLAWARQIQSIAQAGLTYGKDPYDQERYTALRHIAAEIMASHTALSREQVSAALAQEEGYLTPKVDVRAVVFGERGELLLVRERSEGLWALPGGWADVGDTPGEVAAREVLEESGFAVRPVKMLAVLDRARHDHPPLLWHVYKLFIRCELTGGAPHDSLETDGTGFFGRGRIPALSTSRVTAAQVRRMFEHYDHPLLPTDFD